MFSITQRFQTLSNTALTYAIYVAVAVVATFYYQLYFDGASSVPATVDNISIKSHFKSSRSFGSMNKKPKENTKLTFDIDADLSPLFNWNTKQVFVYLTAEYPGKNSQASNKVTYWDKIVTSKEDANLELKNQRSKYNVWDVEKTFRGREAVVRLEWNIQPHIGPLVWGSTVSNATIVYPDSKVGGK
ncbi:signal peptidase complex subunit [Saccharomycopsis crataegensis]|uniref:Signal peptidase subunit 3 n=1 Tax=Saccharomycopsis crataegensis TaxID=43959 RepID=A0AAV5QDD9_9ASCO|nr:signal peptidase complex subunit [Saccharomycopsis crataegensis]